MRRKNMNWWIRNPGLPRSVVDAGNSTNDDKGKVACSAIRFFNPAIGTKPYFGVYATKPFEKGNVVFPTNKTLLFEEGMELSIHVMPFK